MVHNLKEAISLASMRNVLDDLGMIGATKALKVDDGNRSKGGVKLMKFWTVTNGPDEVRGNTINGGG